MPVKIGKKRIGVGVSLIQESQGLFSNLDLGVQASYKLRLFKGELSIGVQAAYVNSAFKGSEVELPDGDDYHESDEAIPTQDLSGNTVEPERRPVVHPPQILCRHLRPPSALPRW